MTPAEDRVDQLCSMLSIVLWQLERFMPDTVRIKVVEVLWRDETVYEALKAERWDDAEAAVRRRLTDGSLIHLEAVAGA